jgi:hypothetical protein
VGLALDRDEHLVEMPLVTRPGPAATQPLAKVCPNLRHHWWMVS